MAFTVSQKIVPPWEQGDHVVEFIVKREEGVQEVKWSRRVFQVDREKLETVGFRWIFPRGNQAVEGLQMIIPVRCMNITIMLLLYNKSLIPCSVPLDQPHLE